MSLTTLVLAPAAFFLYYIVKAYRSTQRGSALPPGPPTTPFIGNILQVPRTAGYKALQPWRIKYGPIFSLKFLHQDVIVLSSTQAVRDILDLKASLTNERYSQPIVQDIIFEGDHLLWMDGQTNALVKSKIYSLIPLSGPALQSWSGVVEAEAIATLFNILAAPDSVPDEMRRFPDSVAVALTYGKRVLKLKHRDGSGFALADFAKTDKAQFQMAKPSVTLPFEVLPWLSHLPTFLQFWRRKALLIKKQYDHISLACLWPDLQKRMATGQDNDCWLPKAIKQAADKCIPFSIDLILKQGLVVLEAGLDTTSTTLLAFVQAMLQSPQSVTRAQLEIDQMLNGSDRLPALSDMEHLPFVKAIVQEVMRWRPAGSSGVPHTAKEDIIYHGYLIPKGAMIVQDVYGITHDPDHYDNPEEFDTERFLKHPHGHKQGVNVEWFRNDQQFGAGRRHCLGKKLAMNNLHSVIVKMLWAFRFEKSGGMLDDPLSAGRSYSSLMAATLIPRSDMHAAKIREAYRNESLYYEKFNPN